MFHFNRPNTILPKRSEIKNAQVYCEQCLSAHVISGVIYREQGKYYQDHKCNKCGYEWINELLDPKYRWKVW